MATLGELVVTTGVLATVMATTVPALHSGLDDARVAGAARYLSSRFAESRMEAIKRSRRVAIRFEDASSHYAFTVYEDGNGNGVLTSDIRRGVDRPIRGPERLSDSFRNVEFGALPGLPPIDAGDSPPGTDPIRFGAARAVSFNPLGQATSGTIYLTGRNHAQYAVRVFGATGKVRVYRYNWRASTWAPL